MHHVREILRLSRDSGLSQNQISKALGLSKGVVQKTLSTFLKSQLPWPLTDGMSDADLAAALFGTAPPKVRNALILPDFERLEKASPSNEFVLIELLLVFQHMVYRDCIFVADD